MHNRNATQQWTVFNSTTPASPENSSCTQILTAPPLTLLPAVHSSVAPLPTGPNCSLFSKAYWDLYDLTLTHLSSLTAGCSSHFPACTWGYRCWDFLGTLCHLMSAWFSMYRVLCLEFLLLHYFLDSPLHFQAIFLKLFPKNFRKLQALLYVLAALFKNLCYPILTELLISVSVFQIKDWN